MAWNLVDLEQLDQATASVVDLGRASDQCDHLIEHVQRLDQAAQHVGLPLSLCEPEARTPLDDLDLVGDPALDELVDRQCARHAVDQREHVGAEVGLQLGVLEQVVQYDARDGITAEYDDEALARAARGVVADIGDALHLAAAHEVGDLLREVVRVDHVRQLGDGQAGAALLVLVDLDDGALGDRPPAGAVGLLDALAAHDEGAVGEVGTLDPLDERVLQLLAGGLRVLERPERTVGDLTQVVRRDVGGHPDRDPRRPVDQQVGVARRQHRRLLRAPVVVGLEVDGVLLDVADHLQREWGHPALGVAHRGRGIVAGRSEVALPVDQWSTHHPGLREAHQGVVDRGVTVWVVLAHDVTDDAGTLGEAAVGTVAAVVHRVEHPAVHRLEAVAYVGKRTPDDDRHRVVDVRALHGGLQLDRLDAAAGAGADGAVGGGLSHVSSLWSVLAHIRAVGA